MGLQVNPPIKLEGPEGGETGGDDWGTRIGKLIPAEALGLYGSAIALLPAPGTPTRTVALWSVVALASLLLIIIRYRSARSEKTGRVQYLAIIISLVSFFIWLYAIGAPTSPIEPAAGFEFTGPLAALVWGTFVPYFYKGRDPQPPSG